MYKDIEKILLTQEQIAKRIADIGRQIAKDYQGENPVLVGILKGSCVFFADLIRSINIPLEIDFLAVSSYGQSSYTTGEVKVVKDLDKSIDGRHVLIVEDIVDSGLTLTFIKQMLARRNTKSVKICTMLDKPSRRKVDITPDYIGFEVENFFLVGYGLDYAQRYRNLPEICVLKPEIYN